MANSNQLAEQEVKAAATNIVRKSQTSFESQEVYLSLSEQMFLLEIG